MKTLYEIKNDVAIERHSKTWDAIVYVVGCEVIYNNLWPEVCRRAQLECARETLKEATENGKTTFMVEQNNEGKPDVLINIVDEKSITDEANIKLIQ